jgi:hypothetical protein
MPITWPLQTELPHSRCKSETFSKNVCCSCDEGFNSPKLSIRVCRT